MAGIILLFSATDDISSSLFNKEDARRRFCPPPWIGLKYDRLGINYHKDFGEERSNYSLQRYLQNNTDICFILNFHWVLTNTQNLSPKIFPTYAQ